jgi:citrate synthase
MNSPDEIHVSAKTAARMLKIDVRTLYAYVSRGWIRSIPSPGKRARLYSRSDIDRLRTRQRARAGHGAAAAGALRWGEPVLESSITEVQSHAIRYRDRDLLTDLVKHRFEFVADWIWTGTPGWEAARWTDAARLSGTAVASAARHARGHNDPKARLAAFVASLAIADTSGSNEHGVLTEARSILVSAAALVSGLPRVDNGSGIATTLAAGWGSPVRQAALHLDAALVICADHELNPSTFVARVAASNGAGLTSCIEAALATHRGTRQGLAADLLEAILDRASGGRSVTVFNTVLERDGGMPGFGHPLYPDGDPRGAFLVDLAVRIAPRNPRVLTITRLVRWARERLNARPNLDCGLVALAASLSLPPLSASSIYCLGRISGWVAHIVEQRQMKFHIRPRARYVVNRESDDPAVFN